MKNIIARWIIDEGINKSYSGSWSVSLDEIKQEFGLELTENQIEEILDCLFEYEEIADVEFIDDEFDYVLYTSYVLKYEED